MCEAALRLSPGPGGDCDWPYLMCTYFVSDWIDLRYRVSAAALPRLRAILDWWTEALAAKRRGGAP